MKKLLLFIEIGIILSFSEFVNMNISTNYTNINDILNEFLINRYCLMPEMLLSLLLVVTFYYTHNIMNKNIFLITIFSLKTNHYWLTKFFISWYISFFSSSFILITIKNITKVRTLDILYSILLGTWLLFEFLKPKDGNKRKRKLKEIIDSITIKNLMRQLMPSDIPV